MLKEWADEIVETSAEDGTTSDSARAAAQKLRDYSPLSSRTVVAGRAMISSAVSWRRRCRDDRAAQAEAVGMCNLLFEAGNSTTSSLIGNSLVALGCAPRAAGLDHRPPRGMAGGDRGAAPVRLARSRTCPGC